MKVKICGLTNKEDGIWAINYGADFLGINFWKESPRHNTVQSASKWAMELPAFTPRVGIFINADLKEIAQAVVKCGLKGVQLHGDEAPEDVKRIKNDIQGMGRPIFVIKAFRIKDEESLKPIEPYIPEVDYVLLDSFVEGELGGTGHRFNWDLAVKAKNLGKPIFLAGGLTPDNVREAIKKVGPFAVDVSSGVEKSIRKKDMKKMEDFIKNAKD